MRLFSLIAVFILVKAAPALAEGCKVIEYPDHNEVVCDGAPANVPPADQARRVDEILQERDRVQQAMIEEQRNADELAEKIRQKKLDIEEMKRRFAEDNKRFKGQRGR